MVFRAILLSLCLLPRDLRPFRFPVSLNNEMEAIQQQIAVSIGVAKTKYSYFLQRGVSVEDPRMKTVDFLIFDILSRLSKILNEGEMKTFTGAITGVGLTGAAIGSATSGGLTFTALGMSGLGLGAVGGMMLAGGVVAGVIGLGYAISRGIKEADLKAVRDNQVANLERYISEIESSLVAEKH